MIGASTSNPAGVINSVDNADVVWDILLTGHAYGLGSSGLVSIAPTPEAGPLATTGAGSSSPHRAGAAGHGRVVVAERHPRVCVSSEKRRSH